MTENPPDPISEAASAETAVVVECELPAPPEKVWRALTSPELLGAWLMPNDMCAEVGRRFAFQDELGTGGRVECEVLAVEPQRLLRYSWRGSESARDGQGRALDTIVTFVLGGTASGGTHLRIVHSFEPGVSETVSCMAGAGRPWLGRRSTVPMQPQTLVRRPLARGRTTMQAGMRLAA